MSDIKILIGADIKELEQKLAVAKAKLAEMGGVAQKAGTGVNALGGVAQKAASSIGTLAGSLISGGLITAVTAVGLALFELGKKMFAISDEAAKLAETQKKINDSLSGGSAAYIKATLEVSNLKVALSQAREGIITKGEALKLYNETIGKTTGQVNTLNEAEQALAKNADAYVEFTLLKAAANVAASKSADKLFESTVNARKEFTSTQRKTDIFGIEFSEDQLTQLETQQRAVFGAARNARTDALKEESDDYKEISQDFFNAANEIATKFKFDFNAIKGVSVKEVKVKAKKIFKGIRFTFDDSDTILFDEESGAKALGAGIENLLKSLKGGSAIGIPVDLQLDPKIKIDANQARESFIKELNKAGISTADRILENGLTIKIPVELATAEELIAALNNFKKNIVSFEKQVIDAVDQTMSNIANNIISSTADSIADALTGGKGVVPRLFDNIIKGVGQQLKELGQTLVRIGLQKLAINKAIEALKINPAVTVVVGFATQVLGALLIASAQKKASGLGQGFASGTTGVNQGGIYDVGERGPERIFLPAGAKVQPNNELNAFNGGNQVFIPALTLSGPDLVIAFNRASQMMNRNN